MARSLISLWVCALIALCISCVPLAAADDGVDNVLIDVWGTGVTAEDNYSNIGGSGGDGEGRKLLQVDSYGTYGGYGSTDGDDALARKLLMSDDNDEMPGTYGSYGGAAADEDLIGRKLLQEILSGSYNSGPGSYNSGPGSYGTYGSAVENQGRKLLRHSHGASQGFNHKLLKHSSVARVVY